MCSVNVPLLLDVPVPIFLLLKRIVSAELNAKFFPVIVTELPTVPRVGWGDMWGAGAGMVKVACVESADPSDANTLNFPEGF